MDELSRHADLLTEARMGPHLWLARGLRPTAQLAGLTALLGQLSAFAVVCDAHDVDSPHRGVLLDVGGGAYLWARTYLNEHGVRRAIAAERGRQDAKYGAHVVGYRYTQWIAALTEEVGEVARECFRVEANDAHERELTAELVQVAALALWWLELIELRRMCA